MIVPMHMLVLGLVRIGAWGGGVGMMGAVNDGVPSSSADEPEVDGVGDGESYRQRDREAPPEEEIGKARVHRAWYGEEDGVVYDFHSGNRDGVGGESQPERLG